MKFEVSISPRDSAKVQLQRIKGLQSLEDACRVALALGPVHYHSALVGVWLAAKRLESAALLAVYGQADEQRAAGFTESARRVLVATVAKRKASRERQDWLKAKDAADNTFSTRLFASVKAENQRDRLWVNQAAITALFANDFATVEKFMAEVAPV